MHTVMFVCQGNICRSPLAEGLFDHLARQRNVHHKVQAESSGTIGFHSGEMPDSRMRQVAQARGVHLSHRAQQFGAQHFECDLILAMDASNYHHILSQATAQQKMRIKMFRSYDPLGGPDAEVPDPYYGGHRGFEEVYEMVERTCTELLDRFEAGQLFAN